MTKNSKFDTLQSKVKEFRDKRNWKKHHTPKDLAISISLEAAELLEHFQWKDSSQQWQHISNEKDAISLEIADILLYLIAISDIIDIDIIQAAEKKIQLNKKKYPIN